MQCLKRKLNGLWGKFGGMMSKNKPSRLLAEIYEIALGFHNCGLLSDEQMNEYKELCLESVTNDLLRENFDEMDSRVVI